MAIRVLGVIIGALALAVPFLGKASFLDTVKSDPKILLVLAMGMVFITYGLGGTRLLVRLRQSWSDSGSKFFLPHELSETMLGKDVATPASITIREVASTSSEAVAAMGVFPISFTDPRHGTSNSFGLMDEGSIAFDSDTVRVVGRRRKLFGTGSFAELAIRRAAVVNVHCVGRSLRIEVEQSPEEALLAQQWLPSERGGSGPPFITVWARDEASAEEIEGMLPRRESKSAVEKADFQQRLERVTPKVYVTYVLIALNVLVFAAMVAAGAGFFTPNPKVHLQWGSNFGPLTTHGEWWRLVTCTFVHFGVLHLAFNMWALYENGRIVERLYGNLYFLAVYLFAGITGSLTSVFWHPMVNSAGASGAIFGVLGALLAFTVVMHQSIPFAVRKAQRNSTIVFILYALTSGFTATGVDNAAHLGGLAGGFLAGLALARPLDPEQRRSGGVRRFVSAAIIVLAAAVVLVPLLRRSADPTAYIVHGMLEGKTGEFDAAIADFSHAIELDPKQPQAYLLRGGTKAGKGDIDGAIADYGLALDVDPKSFGAYTLRGNARSAKGDFPGAIADLSRAIEIDPQAPQAYNDLAWALATAEPPAMRDGRRAVELALRACELSQWKNPGDIDTLAAAYARNGDFVKAVEWQRKAMADPKLKGSDKAQERLRLYEANKAWPPD